MTLLRWLTFLLRTQTVISQSCSFRFLSSDASICSTMTFSPLGNSDHVVVSLSIDFPSYLQLNALFPRIAYDYYCADWDSLCDHFRDNPWKNIFKLSVSAAASEFYDWVQVGIYVCIPHWKYQVKPHSSPWFSASYTAAIVHRNHFFVCTKGINLLNLKSKGFLKLPDLDILIKQKNWVHHFPETWPSGLLVNCQ